MQTFDWMQENYPREFRFENAIITADNVLDPAVIQEVRGRVGGEDDWGGWGVWWRDGEVSGALDSGCGRGLDEKEG